MSALPVTFDVIEFFRGKKEHVRLLRKNEVIPTELEAAFDILGQLDPDWVWVLDDSGTIKGVLVASPCHGAAMVWRVSLAKDVSNIGLRRLLRRFVRDCKKRGLLGLITFMSLSGGSQSSLAAIIERAGGRKIQDGMTMMILPQPRRHF